MPDAVLSCPTDPVSFSQECFEAGVIVILTLWIRKLRLREFKQLAHDIQLASSRVRLKPMHSHPEPAFPSMMLSPELWLRILLGFPIGALLHQLAALMQILAEVLVCVRGFMTFVLFPLSWFVVPNRI